jgi:hypothetical protein
MFTVKTVTTPEGTSDIVRFECGHEFPVHVMLAYAGAIIHPYRISECEEAAFLQELEQEYPGEYADACAAPLVTAKALLAKGVDLSGYGILSTFFIHRDMVEYVKLTGCKTSEMDMYLDQSDWREGIDTDDEDFGTCY